MVRIKNCARRTNENFTLRRLADVCGLLSAAMFCGWWSYTNNEVRNDWAIGTWNALKNYFCTFKVHFVRLCDYGGGATTFAAKILRAFNHITGVAARCRTESRYYEALTIILWATNDDSLEQSTRNV